METQTINVLEILNKLADAVTRLQETQIEILNEVIDLKQNDM